jgi:hypothetical protein
LVNDDDDDDDDEDVGVMALYRQVTPHRVAETRSEDKRAKNNLRGNKDTKNK